MATVKEAKEAKESGDSKPAQVHLAAGRVIAGAHIAAVCFHGSLP